MHSASPEHALRKRQQLAACGRQAGRRSDEVTVVLPDYGPEVFRNVELFAREVMQPLQQAAGQ